MHTKNKKLNINNQNSNQKIDKDLIKNSFIKPINERKRRNSGIVSRIIKEDFTNNINSENLNETNIEISTINENKKFEEEINIIKKEIEYPVWFENKKNNNLTKKDIKNKMKEIEEIALKYGKFALCDNLINNKNFNDSDFLYYVSNKEGICYINTFLENKNWKKIENNDFLELENNEKKYLFKIFTNIENNETYYVMLKKIIIDSEELYFAIGLNINNPYIYLNYLKNITKEIIKNKNIDELKILVNNENVPLKNIFPLNYLLIEKDEFDKDDLKKDIIKKMENIKIKNNLIEDIEKNNGKYIETIKLDSCKIINYGKRIIIKNKENDNLKFYYFICSLIINIDESEIINNLIDINKNILNQILDNNKKNNTNENVLNFEFLNENILNKFITTIILKNNNIIYSNDNNSNDYFLNILKNNSIKEGINFIDIENENFIIYKKFNFKKENTNDEYIFLNSINPSSKIYKSYNFLKKIINEIENSNISKLAIDFYSKKIKIPYSWLKIDIYDEDKRLILSNHETDKLWNKFDRKGQIKNNIISNKILLKELNNKPYLIYKIEKNEPKLNKEKNIKNNLKNLIILISW